MNKYIKPELWQTAGIDTLEPVADEVVRNIKCNQLVIAGPGAGKTELLAQKACYLLQTGLCPEPNRILAISFKRDAAKNLKDRVELRCGKELARRFDSLTFDAFAKGLLDRFRKALPVNYRPTDEYKIDFEMFKAKRVEDLLLQISSDDLSMSQLADVNRDRFEDYYITKKPLPLIRDENIKEFNIASKIWDYLLKDLPESKLSFKMISRLAELIVKNNKYIKIALQSTYSYVFIDEFQDTTNTQYDLAKRCFLDSNSKITAVGDNKQTIMDWAGALKEIFSTYLNDFSAEIFRLQFNYRSAPKLVEIQHKVACHLEQKDISCSIPKTDGDGVCSAYEFDDYDKEADYIAKEINDFINTEGLNAKDICILSRNRPGDYGEQLINALKKYDIKSRDESSLQDLLCEPLIILLLSFLKLIVLERSPDSWEKILKYLSSVEHASEDHEFQNLEDNLIGKLDSIKSIYDNVTIKDNFNSIIGQIIEYLVPERLKSEYPQYSQGAFFDEMISSFQGYMEAYLNEYQLQDAINEFEGIDSIPIMTIHKSKGLEYHTVIFIGLEDGAFWGYKKNPYGEACSFFVALSRAKYRVIFTMSSIRKNSDGYDRKQLANNIKELYDILDAAGIHRVRISS